MEKLPSISKQNQREYAMNPTEKAKELFNLFFPLVEAHSSEGQIENAKKCALIAVDELIYHIRWNLSYGYEKQIEYYKEVKQEINKL